MISSLLHQGEQPVLTDMVTSNVLRGAFGLETVSKRFDPRFVRIDVDWLLAMNSEKRENIPVGALSLLLENESFSSREDNGLQAEGEYKPVTELLLDVARLLERNTKTAEKDYPYRCLINLHGFTPSWVGSETGHWSWKWAEPSLIYEFKGKRGKDMEQLLRDDPPENCMVYF